MVRDVTDGKIDWTLALDGPMFKRYAELMHRGATKYGKRNWMKANSQEESDRAMESLVRHFFQYVYGETDEDHAAAIFFNLNEIEYVKDRMKRQDNAEEAGCENKSTDGWWCEKDYGHGGKHGTPNTFSAPAEW